MASKPKSEEDLTCPVCCEIYNDPVVLSCSHSVCKDCLQLFWNNKGSQECPVCKRQNNIDPPRNLALKNLCEAFLLDRDQTNSTGSKDLCSLHSEKLKLFCLEDKLPICLVCRDSKKHKNHDCFPIEEVLQDLKDDLKTALKPLQEKLQIFEKAKLSCNQIARHLRVQARKTERQIKEEFERLHQFLRDEEAARIAALREEEEQKSHILKKRIQELERDISSLSDTIKTIGEQLKANDLSFLQNFQGTMKRAQCTLQDPQMLSGELIHVANHLGNLKFRVWEKMQENFQIQDMILDPNTSHPQLILSEDLTSVRFSDQCQQLPNNPERFDRYFGVLGSEGFDSGTHCWDVDVGGSTRWALGIITESVKRKGNSFSSGVWRLWSYDGHCKSQSPTQAELQPLLTVNEKLQRVRVQLDWDRGKLTFFDPLKNKHILTSTHTFTEKVFPLFWNYCKLSPLSILPVQTSVTANQHS
ncbi:zinc-binding protein A33-like [Chanos chanos]|uniref:Zinc-binding protein A33-like n=1 Tax=Chanos chanos TaxID=29144 RepID=A0A6J2UTM6_CHACN|nr:zinc-binding protein A33-like [Chanos chanos]